jgi:hypothetical protein
MELFSRLPGIRSRNPLAAVVVALNGLIFSLSRNFKAWKAFNSSLTPVGHSTGAVHRRTGNEWRRQPDLVSPPPQAAAPLPAPP